jgi:ABC-type branched-subunit amino acid transport system ATPase component
MMADLMLEVKNLSGGYDDLIIVKNISLNVYSGQVVSVTGRNGVGKSTLMKLISGSLKLSDGTVFVLNQDVRSIAKHKRLKMGVSYAPQESIVFDELSLEENLTLHYEGTDLESYDEVFKYFPRLKERLGQRAGTLSGGEKKLLSFSRVIAEPTKMVLLDEPTEGVQSDNIELMAEIIIKEKAKGRGFLIVDQNLTFLEKFNDVIHLMDHGEAIFKMEGLMFREDIEERITI